MKRFDYPRLQETVYRETLPNGLTIAVVPRPGFSRKEAFFVTDFGSIHTRFRLDGQEYLTPDGIAHYLEHKMFDLPGRDVSAEFAAMGASTNAFTSYDVTAYYFSCTDHFEDCLRLLLEFVSTPYFTPESVEKEQGIIGQEIGMNEDSPDSVVFEELCRAMYAEHNIRIPILGTVETIAQITPEFLHTCHRAFYAPGNMMLCVAGDVEPDQVAAIAAELLPKEAAAPAEKLTPMEQSLSCPVPFVSRQMDVAMQNFQLGFKCAPVPKGEEGIRQEVVGDLAAELLFGEASELYLRMYEDGLIDSSFGGGFETVDGMAMLTCGGDSEHAEEVRDAILAQAKVLCDRGINEQDFLRMKKSILGRKVRELDNFTSTCVRLCTYHFAEFDYMDFPRVLEAVTCAEVEAFLRQAVQAEHCALAVICPREQEA